MLPQPLSTGELIQSLAGSPKLLAFIEANFNGQNDQVRERLAELVDESEYDLRQWVKSLSIMGHWLDSRSLHMPLDEQLGYVCCSVEAIGAGAGFEDLPSLVTEMLERYGCERAVKK